MVLDKCLNDWWRGVLLNLYCAFQETQGRFTCVTIIDIIETLFIVTQYSRVKASNTVSGQTDHYNLSIPELLCQTAFV